MNNENDGRPTFDTIAKMYQKKACNLTATAAALGYDRRTLFNWRKKYPELEEMLHDIDESLIDFTESKLMEQINEGNLTAILFHLKTKGKNRGYVERQDVTTNGKDIQSPEIIKVALDERCYKKEE